jgi:hypothetical protein
VQLAALPRNQILHHLCALALIRRPGVLRCCIQRTPRDALRKTLGGAFDALMSLSSKGRPVSSEVACWSPMQWSCVGYGDWMALLEPGDRIWRRLVRLSLPRGLLGTSSMRDMAPAEVKPLQAMTSLKHAGVAWS